MTMLFKVDEFVTEVYFSTDPNAPTVAVTLRSRRYGEPYSTSGILTIEESLTFAEWLLQNGFERQSLIFPDGGVGVTSPTYPPPTYVFVRKPKTFLVGDDHSELDPSAYYEQFKGDE